MLEPCRSGLDRDLAQSGSKTSRCGAPAIASKLAPTGPVHASTLAQVEPVQLHHLGPHRDEILHELGLGIIAGVHLGNRT